jgi:hypothetical protein
MATQDDVRRIISKLPGSVEGEERFGFSVPVKGKLKGFLWSWAEKVDPKKARVINDGVIAVVTPGLAAKELLLASNPEKYFTEPHYNGFPAVLVRLDEATPEDLEDLILEAWKCKAPPELRRQFEAQASS